MRKPTMYQQPWKLIPNKIRGAGGRQIDRFRGLPDPQDTLNGAEAWVGSVTRALGASPQNPDQGCAQVELPNGERKYLYQVIEEAPEAILGSEHMKRFGTGLGILVKELDAKNKFLLQCHPTRQTAAELWGSSFGKTECWHVINVRDDTPEPPFIWLGFKPGVTRNAFEEAFRNSTLEQAEGMCHKFVVQPGQTYFIPGGMPHALGPGCFVFEIQEPTDFTAVPLSQQDYVAFRQKANPAAVFTPVDDELYERRTLGSFDYTGRTLSEVLALTKSSNPAIRSGEWGEERLIVGPEQTTYFSCTSISVNGEVDLLPTGRIQIGIVTEGEGEIITPEKSMFVKKGSELFFPYAVANVKLRGRFVLLLSHP